MGEVILVSRASLHKNGVVSTMADSSPLHVDDIVMLTGEVLKEQGNLFGNSR